MNMNQQFNTLFKKKQFNISKKLYNTCLSDTAQYRSPALRGMSIVILE